VFVRSRPLKTKGPEAEAGLCVTFPDQFTVVHNSARTGRTEIKEFPMTRVFPPECSQTEVRRPLLGVGGEVSWTTQVFEDVERLVYSARDGYNVCIFAYGQTGSGKTCVSRRHRRASRANLCCRFTMIGGGDGRDREMWGVAPRAIETLFRIVHNEQSERKTFEVEVYMVELYRDKFYDLLCDKSNYGKAKLDVKRSAQDNLMYVQGAEIKTVTSDTELVKMLLTGMANRRTSATRTATLSRAEVMEADAGCRDERH
jgi:hypothetical protein